MATTTGHGLITTTAVFALVTGIFGIGPFTMTLAALISLYCAFYTTLPDIYGILGGSPWSYVLYEKAHYGILAARYTSNSFKDLLYRFHLAYDKIFHAKTGGWYWYGYPIEVVQDAICVTLLISMLGVGITSIIVGVLLLYPFTVFLFQKTILSWKPFEVFE